MSTKSFRYVSLYGALAAAEGKGYTTFISMNVKPRRVAEEPRACQALRIIKDLARVTDKGQRLTSGKATSSDND